ncbi:serine protease SP24D [Eurytemora carolleeae]|uniref:serine protease SP24D n=1 Tax=Eurytemora carolleeae TaxID=1294199 RepID=UPI000C77ED15|nr:serine protease SP24D [Eurytemora carolleeae]|eukprot:XP_023340565.1 serine protease SP24D-like [Eurytemora affinis]
MVYIEYTDNDGNGGTCGASVISSNVLLTAAHCVFLNATIEVILGHVKIKDGAKHPIKKKLVHPEFFMYNRTKHLNNDIALLYVSPKMNITPISIIKPSQQVGHLEHLY